MSAVVPDELLEAIKARRCALFVGAGLSMNAGLPKWDDLLSTLIAKAAELGALGGDRKEELEKHLAVDKEFLMVAEELRDQMGDGPFRDELANIILGEGPPTEVHKLLHEVNASCIITTNYDKLIENAYAAVRGEVPSVYTYDRPGDVLDQLWREKYFILKAHGTVDERSSMVITRRDYRDLIYRATGYRAVLQTIFNMKSILFLGVGLHDPELDLLLAYLHDAFAGSVQKHFVLLPTDKVTGVTRDRWRKDYSVRVIEYEATDGHPQVHEFVQQLVAVNEKGPAA